MRFIDIVNSHDINGLVSLTTTSPLHVDSLLIRSDFLKSNDALQSFQVNLTALWMLERTMQKTIGTRFFRRKNQFNETSEKIKEIKIFYEIKENRMLHLSLLRHVLFLMRKGLVKSALESAKLMLCFDPNDPVGIAWIMDQLCVRSGEFKFLNSFLIESNYENEIFAFYGLALLKILREKNLEPFLIALNAYTLTGRFLLEKLKVVEHSSIDYPPIVKFYVENSFLVWNQPAIIEFLREKKAEYEHLLTIDFDPSEYIESAIILPRNLKRFMLISGSYPIGGSSYDLCMWDPFPEEKEEEETKISLLGILRRFFS